MFRRRLNIQECIPKADGRFMHPTAFVQLSTLFDRIKGAKTRIYGYWLLSVVVGQRQKNSFVKFALLPRSSWPTS